MKEKNQFITHLHLKADHDDAIPPLFMLTSGFISKEEEKTINIKINVSLVASFPSAASYNLALALLIHWLQSNSQQVLGKCQRLKIKLHPVVDTGDFLENEMNLKAYRRQKVSYFIFKKQHLNKIKNGWRLYHCIFSECVIFAQMHWIWKWHNEKYKIQL